MVKNGSPENSRCIVIQDLDCTNITDLSPLEGGMATLKNIILPPHAKDFEFLRNDTHLERISFEYQSGKGPAETAAEFWAARDKSSP